jgi:predicted CXXCH cytochrome family protein
VVALVGGAIAADWWIALPADVRPKYVGRQACQMCHPKEYQAWHNCDHDRAMDLATAETVLGDFDNRQFEYHGLTTTFFRRGDEFFVTTDGPDGALHTYRVKYTFGVRPLQQYMVEMERGRVQVLPWAWDLEKRRWFHVYENEPRPIRSDDPLHWTRSGQNWNHMCAECHSTNVQKAYDAPSDTFRTTYSEIDVSCEACHGPASIHVQLASAWSLFWDRRHGLGLTTKLKVKDNRPQIEMCARCHAHRGAMYPDYHPGAPLADHYAPSLLDTGLYYEDGQIREEVYEYGSFLQSLMYRKGVKCTDCHDPHSTRIKFTDNRLCLQCHLSVKYDTPLHHHHLPGGAGASCIQCHMPARKYMVIDPRRDHSIRPPRPDLSVLLGTPNSCTGCHFERNKPAAWRDYAQALDEAHSGRDPAAREHLRKLDQWAAEKIVAWYGPKRRDDPHFALALAAGIRGQLEAGHPSAPDRVAAEEEIVSRLVRLTQSESAGPIVRASAVSLLGRYPVEAALEANQKALADPEPLVRHAAVTNLQAYYDLPLTAVWSYSRLSPGERAAVDRRLDLLREQAAPLLDDPLRLVRREAARVMTIIPADLLPGRQRARFEEVFREFEQGQLASADQAPSLVTLGGAYARQGRISDAVSCYEAALRLQDSFIPAYTALATLHNYQGRNDQAEKLLRRAIDILRREGETFERDLGECYFNLGLLLAENDRRAQETAQALGEAARRVPNHPRYRYNYGLALMKLPDLVGAERELLAAYELDREPEDFLVALLSLYKEAANWPRALHFAKLLLERHPGHHELEAEVKRLQEKANARPVVGPKQQ